MALACKYGGECTGCMMCQEEKGEPEDRWETYWDENREEEP